MTFSDANRVSLRFSEETAWGETISGPAMQDLNIVSESLQANFNTVTSETIRSDRNVSDIKQTGGGAGGDVAFEVRYGEMDDLIAGAMMEAWATTRVSTAVASARVSAGIIQADSSALNAIVSGQFLRLSNATTSGNDGDYQVTAVSTTGAVTRLGVVEASSGAAPSFTSEVFGASTVLQGKHIRNGTTKKSFLFEKQYNDVSAVHAFTGSRIGSMTLDFQSQAILTGTFNITGKDIQISSATNASAVTSAVTTDVMNASNNVGRIWEGSEVVTGVCFQSFSLNLNNNTREQAKVGQSALAGVAIGRAEVTGDMVAYFENNSLISKFANDTASNFRVQIDDTNGNSYIITIPRFKFTDANANATGGNSDILQNLSWGATVDDDGVYAIQIDALDA